jgi:hypothetical protein
MLFVEAAPRAIARWRIEDTGGTIRMLDGAELRVVTLPQGNSWLSPRG